MKEKCKHINDTSLLLGIVLCIIGVSLGGIIKLLVKSNLSWISTVISILSIVLMLDRKRILQFKYHKPTPLMWAIFSYSIVTLVMSLFSDNVPIMSGYGFVHQSVYFLQILILWDIGNDLNLELLHKVFFLIMSVAIAASFILILQHGALTGDLGFVYLLNSDESTTGVSRTTMGAIGFVAAIVALTYQPKMLWDRLTRYACFFLGVCVLGIAGRRSVYLALIAALCLHVIKTKNKVFHFSLNSVIKAIIIVSLIFLSIFFLYKHNLTFQEKIIRAFEGLHRGIRTYLGLNNDDLAVSYRREWINTFPRDFFFHSSIIHFVFGRGYMTDWLDVPYMQAFRDLGLLGGLYYFCIMAIIPVLHILKPTKNRTVMFAQYNLCLTLVEGFANGCPYGRFFAFVLLLVMEEKEKTEGNKTELKHDSHSYKA